MAEFHYSFNTSTVRGQKLSLVEVVDIAAQAGYHAIEPWVKELETYVQQGGSLPDLKKHIADSGLSVESAIGFAEWIVDDEERRTKGLEQARRDMDLVQQIGGKRIAAPAAGATDVILDYSKVIDRYRACLRWATILTSFRKSKCGVSRKRSRDWGRRRWWPSKAIIPALVCCRMYTTCTKAARISTGWRCSARLQFT